MSFSPKLNLNYQTLKWARKNAGLVHSDISDIKTRHIKDLESGRVQPTLNEAYTLADCYGVPLNIFYFPPPKKSISDLTDFRQVSKEKRGGNKSYSKELRLLINKLQQRQNWLKDYFKEEKVKPLSFVHSVKINDNTQRVANKIVNSFFNSRKEYLKFHEEKKLIEESLKIRKKRKQKNLSTLIKKLGNYGVIVLKCKAFNNENRIELKEARGFILSDKYAPFIFLHSEDYITAQIFTLIHELAHLFINESGVVGELSKNSNKIEKFCNQVASRFLLTEKELSSSFDLEKNDNKSEMSKEKITKIIKKVSDKFFISKLSVLLRLKEQQIIKDNLFNSLWSEFYTEMEEWISKNKEKTKDQSGGNYYNTMVSRTNRDFIKIVYSAYQTKNITGSQASSLLNLKVDNFKTLIEHIRKQA